MRTPSEANKNKDGVNVKPVCGQRGDSGAKNQFIKMSSQRSLRGRR